MTEKVLTKGDLVDLLLGANLRMRSDLLDVSEMIDVRRFKTLVHKYWKDERVPNEEVATP